MHKNIHKIISALPVDMGGLAINQPLPTREVEYIDPFLLIHHGDFVSKGGKRPQDSGVGPHPHRGFSPVTFVYKGSSHHRDSMGNDAVVRAGGTQWMHAGSGIFHSERPDREQAEQGGPSEFIQFWVNSPAARKMDTPSYQQATDEETPRIERDGATIGVVAGEFEGVQGPMATLTPQIQLRVSVRAGADFSLAIPEAYNTLLYALDGGLEVNGQNVDRHAMVWFGNEGELIRVRSGDEARFMLLSGEPIGEPVVSYGPFVMNTSAEIIQAVADSQSDKMGMLVEAF